jgi:riboflavin-specific deaminase-like protein
MSDQGGAQRPSVTIAGYYSGMELPAPPADRPFVYLNMVTSVDGKATVDGSERGLGSADDKRMMQELRVHADAVMNGASTLRVSGSTPRVLDRALKQQRRDRGLSPQPLGVVVTRSGAVPLDVPFFTSSEFDAVVIVTDTTPSERVRAIRDTGRRVVAVPNRLDNGRDIVEVLQREFGVRRLLCEGGPTLNDALIRAGVVDELFITLAPWIVAGTGNLTAVEGLAFARETMPRLSLKAHLHDAATDELYLRYAVSYRHLEPGESNAKTTRVSANGDGQPGVA